MDFFEIASVVLLSVIGLLILFVLTYHSRLLVLTVSNSDTSESPILAVVPALSFVGAIIVISEFSPLQLSPWYFAGFAALDIILTGANRLLASSCSSNAT